ncbi:hypothetical protein [Nitratidesulfovibrio sp. SRB-5]|uniref:hypothetical protein n=1 Tax=Nitratidesulfovibrio sp. SRB-5 TaxID=2872636 RepID=UPI0010269F4A|nr:hypothetical protein [Nitratidesulfovibrio sp. SRB-5]MBZ2172176.1 hypothetical protein [Nitratidesulfovibrio sp. SRB-5]RXF77371.1 hypothetical protein EKK70_06900 [Desulfovibrio sp. DS-1]
MKKYIICVILLLFGVAISAVFFISTENKISSQEIQSDIDALNKEIAGRKAESSRYGGALKVILDAQILIHENTLAALMAKKASLIHRVQLVYPSSRLKPTGGAAGDKESYIAVLEKEMVKMRGAISADEQELSLYSGGLIQVVILMRKAQHQVTLAALEHRLMAAKYDFPVLLALDGEGERISPDGSQVVSDPEKDKGAL